MIKSNYVVEFCCNSKIIIRDIGPWEQYTTVTNNAEGVIAEINEKLSQVGGIGQKRVFYYDSEGDYDELCHDGNGNFTGFHMMDARGG